MGLKARTVKSLPATPAEQLCRNSAMAYISNKLARAVHDGLTIIRGECPACTKLNVDADDARCVVCAVIGPSARYTDDAEQVLAQHLGVDVRWSNDIIGGFDHDKRSPQPPEYDARAHSVGKQLARKFIRG